MANNTTFLFLSMLMMMMMILVSLHPQMALSSTEDAEEEEENDEAEYVLDIPSLSSNSETRSRFLASTTILKKGLRCDNSSVASNICNGVKASKGTGLLFCCKKHCRNVLSDKNNCGVCGHKCIQGHRCCNGVCTNVFFNGGAHCGKCNKNCSPGVPCEFGFCGYA